jgi:hypothetical protein
LAFDHPACRQVSQTTETAPGGLSHDQQNQQTRNHGRNTGFRCWFIRQRISRKKQIAPLLAILQFSNPAASPPFALAIETGLARRGKETALQGIDLSASPQFKVGEKLAMSFTIKQATRYETRHLRHSL